MLKLIYMTSQSIPIQTNVYSYLEPFFTDLKRIWYENNGGPGIEDILQKSNVFITPGFIFGSNGNKYIRISLCCSIERFKLAFDRIKNFKKGIYE